MIRSKDPIKSGSTLFLKFAILLISLVTIAALIHFPMSEGRAKDLDLLHIYADPLIIFGYISSIPFFIVLFQLIKLLGFVDKNKVFSENAVKAVKIIKYCALSIPVFIFIALVYIRLNVAGDDPAGPTGFGVVVSLIFIILATGAEIFQRILQNAVDIKIENDLTV